MEKPTDHFPQIANYLLLHSYTINDVSLYHGKTGIVLAMMMYAEVSKNQVLKEYSEDLFQTIYKGVHDGMPIGIEYGLAGVGLGMTLMKKANLIDCNLNNVLFDIDAKIMAHNPFRIKDFSFRKGLAGIIAYINLRKSVEGRVLSFDKDYLSQLSMIYQRHKEEFDSELCKNVIDDLERPDWEKSSYKNKCLGLEKGCSYYLFKANYDKFFLNSK